MGFEKQNHELGGLTLFLLFHELGGLTLLPPFRQ